MKCYSTVSGFNWSTGKAAVAAVAATTVVARAVRTVAVEGIAVVVAQGPVLERRLVPRRRVVPLLERARGAAIVAEAQAAPQLERLAVGRTVEAIAAQAAA